MVRYRSKEIYEIRMVGPEGYEEWGVDPDEMRSESVVVRSSSGMVVAIIDEDTFNQTYELIEESE